MNDDEIERRVRALPEVPLPPALAARVHRRARAELEAGGAGRLAALATAAAVVSAIAVYLAWAVRFLRALASG
ncbi:MAG TPA: hypothetical protein VHL80_03435 [Polyangia bacterium]|nr:hypothetical protein [Polyangia bacterium]